MEPTQDAMVVRHSPEAGERHLDLLKWGLLPYFMKDPAHTKRAEDCRYLLWHVQVGIHAGDPRTGRLAGLVG